MVKVLSEPPITWMKNIASGANKTICRIELIATRMAQYSLSPPASLVQTSTYTLLITESISLWVLRQTIAMHRAIPTKIKPSLRSLSSGRKAHANASYDLH